MNTRVDPKRSLEIQFNDIASRVPCPLCEGLAVPGVGPGVFLSGTRRPVCHECGEEHDPDLMRELEKVRRAPEPPAHARLLDLISDVEAELFRIELAREKLSHCAAECIAVRLSNMSAAIKWMYCCEDVEVSSTNREARKNGAGPPWGFRGAGQRRARPFAKFLIKKQRFKCRGFWLNSLRTRTRP